MAGEISVYGVFFPFVQVQGLIALAIFFIARKIMVRRGAYQWVWHPALFDIAFFCVIFYVVFKFSFILR